MTMTEGEYRINATPLHGAAGDEKSALQPDRAQAVAFVDDAPGMAGDSGVIFAEWRPMVALGDVVDAWQDLAARTLDPNVFYEPAFALSAVVAFGRDVGAILVWQEGEPRRLLGFFPARIERRRYGVPMPVLVGWTHPYAPFGAPLVDRDCSEIAIETVLDFVARAPDLPKLLLLPLAPVAGPLASALSLGVFRAGGRMAWFAQHERAMLSPPPERDQYLDQAMSSQKRRRLRRQGRRLADDGRLFVTSASDPSKIKEALDAYLTLEAKGWKGRARTAASHDPEIESFVRRAVTALAAGGQARVDRLMLNTKVIAAAIVLRSGAAGWFWKIAYDEDYARASPGVQLALEITESLVADHTIAVVDSCAPPDYPMIDTLWHDRLMLGNQFIAVGPRATMLFAIASRLEWLRTSGRSAGKQALHRARSAAVDIRKRVAAIRSR